MESVRFTELCRWFAREAVYDVARKAAASIHTILSREEFIRQKYLVATSCDGMVAIAQATGELNLILGNPPRGNGPVNPPFFTPRA